MASTMPAADTLAGALFGMLFAPVGTDWSRGNASNWYAPGKVKQKLGTIRKSYNMSGHAKDFVMTTEIPTEDGKRSKFWMDFEEWQHMLAWKEEGEMYYWYGEQTYDSSGEVHLKDERGQPIVIPPGLLQQIVNKDTYSQLTEAKLKSLIREIYYGMTDNKAKGKVITLMTGVGGKDEFDVAMKNEISARSYTVLTSGQLISGTGRALTLTGYFTTYEHVDGYTIRLITNPLFDHSVVAEASIKHPISGLPLESHRMVFIDSATYEGEPNLCMVNKLGREFLRWAVAGSVVPRGFTGSELRASDIDGCAIHFLKQGHVLLRRFDTSIDLQCVLA
jgi:hypothetical protein